VALSAVFTSAASAIEAADQKRAQWLDAVRAAKLEVARAQVVYKFFKAVVVGQFGADNETVLGDFVIPTAPQTTVLAATKAAAALKAKATREARGTKGKKQRAAIKGSVEVTITAVPLVTAPAREPPDAQK
jgi:hypothetical protein